MRGGGIYTLGAGALFLEGFSNLLQRKYLSQTLSWSTGTNRLDLFLTVTATKLAGVQLCQVRAE